MRRPLDFVLWFLLCFLVLEVLGRHTRLYPRSFTPIALGNKFAQYFTSEPIPQLLTAQTHSVTPSHLERMGSGTAFLVKTTASGEALFLTNEHVVNGCQEIVVEQRELAAVVTGVRRSQTADLALVSVQSDQAKKDASFFPLSRAKKGERVVVYGYPLDGVLARDGIVSEGIVNSVGQIDREATFFQISAPIQQGNSGSVVVNNYGDLIGVATAKLNALSYAKGMGDLPQNVNFGVSSQEVKRFLDSEGIVLPLKERDAFFFDFLLVPSKENLIKRIDEATVRLACYGDPKPLRQIIRTPPSNPNPPNTLSVKRITDLHLESIENIGGVHKFFVKNKSPFYVTSVFIGYRYSSARACSHEPNDYDGVVYVSTAIFPNSTNAIFSMDVPPRAVSFCAVYGLSL